MKTGSRYHRLLVSLLRRPSFTAEEARRLGVPSHALVYLVKTGVLDRIARGIYRSSAYEPEVDVTLEELVLVASTIPNAVVCLISALDYYDLTDELPREHWIAVPHAQRAPVRPYTRIVKMRNTELGRESIRLGEHDVMIFDRERCVVDAFRYLSPEIAIKALRAYLGDKTRRPDLKKLSKYAKSLRVKLRPYILSLTT